MNQISANSNSANKSLSSQAVYEARCQKHTRNGRCRLSVADSSSKFCSEHSRRHQKQVQADDLSAILTAGLTEFKSAIPINEFLSRLLLNQAQDRIPPRRAAVMAYTCNLLLRTLPAIEHELHPEDEPQQIIIDLPRPDRSQPNSYANSQVTGDLPSPKRD